MNTHKLMKVKYYYIHGLNSSSKSSKFLLFSNNEEFKNIECLEWISENNMTKKLNLWSDKIKKIYDEYDRIVIIGDSFGGNLACHLKQLLWKTSNKYVSLILINPLLEISYVANYKIISNHLRNYIVPITRITESLIFISQNDEVINNIQLIGDNPFIKHNNQIVLDLENDHKFLGIDAYFDTISGFVYNIYL